LAAVKLTNKQKLINRQKQINKQDQQINKKTFYGNFDLLPQIDKLIL
jgi:hypothetical protein